MLVTSYTHVPELKEDYQTSAKSQVKKYESLRTHCPCCLGEWSGEITCLGILDTNFKTRVDRNHVYCYRCEWRGIFHHLVSETETSKWCVEYTDQQGNTSFQDADGELFKIVRNYAERRYEVHENYGSVGEEGQALWEIPFDCAKPAKIALKVKVKGSDYTINVSFDGDYPEE